MYKLFNDLISAYKPQAIKELKEVEQLAKEMEGDAFEMQPLGLWILLSQATITEIQHRFGNASPLLRAF